MKTKEFKDNIKNMGLNDLTAQLVDLRGNLFALRLRKITSHVKNHAEIRLLRKNIARTLTVLRHKACCQ